MELPCRHVENGSIVTALSVEDLRVEYHKRRWFRTVSHVAVEAVSFSVEPGRTVGLVGQSGSGKSSIARAVLGLVKPAAGTVTVSGTDTTGRVPATLAATAGKVQAVFQDPTSSLDPRFSIERSVLEPIPGAPSERAAELLDLVGLDRSYLGRRPHQLSGGQRQRVAIARALASTPETIICDEPVSALDVSTQALILDLLRRIQRETGVALLFIGHDLGVMHYISDELVVLHKGRVEEQGSADDVCLRPRAVYTQALLQASPLPDPALQRERRSRRLHDSAVADSTVGT